MVASLTKEYYGTTAGIEVDLNSNCVFSCLMVPDLEYDLYPTELMEFFPPGTFNFNEFINNYLGKVRRFCLDRAVKLKTDKTHPEFLLDSEIKEIEKRRTQRASE